VAFSLNPASLFSFLRTTSNAPGTADNEPPPPPHDPRVADELGATGTINLRGFLQGQEYNADLKGRAALDVFDRMRLSDPAVREALGHIIQPLLNATWEIQPAGNLPIDLRRAALANALLFQWLGEPTEGTAITTGPTFLATLSELLELYLAMGHHVAEMVEMVVEDAELHYHSPNGEEVSEPAAMYLVWKKIATRLPRTIWKWHQYNGEVTAIEQLVWKNDSYQRVQVPGQDLLIFVNAREGDDFTGRSILRAAYKPWVLKELFEKISGIAVERHGVGIPVAYPPADKADDEATIQRLSDILMNLRGGACSFVVMPGPKETSRHDGYTLEILAPPGGIPDFTPLLEYCRGEIKGSMLVRFAELGHGQTGARATGDTQSQVWTDALHAVGRAICDVLSIAIARQVNRNIADRGSGDPKLVVRDVESKDLAEYAQAYAQLVTSEAVIPDKSFRAHVRDAIDAPAEDPTTVGLPDDGSNVEVIKNPPQPPVLPGAGGEGGTKPAAGGGAPKSTPRTAGHSKH
jgi:hypothetical protein